MHDDELVLGEQRSGDDPTPPVPKPWMVVAGVVTVAVIVFSSGTGTGPPTTSSTTTVAPSTTVPERPSVSVAPTHPSGEIVAQTMEWELASGFEEAAAIGGIAEFRGEYWVVGTTATGLTLWRGDGSPGAPWRVTSRIEGTDGWYAANLAVVEDQLVVAAAPRTGEGSLFLSADGDRWEPLLLEPSSPDLPRTVATRVLPAADGVVVTGYAMSLPPEEILDLLESPVAELVASGDAFLEARPNGVVVVTIQPGIEVYRITQPEFPEGYEPVPASSQTWHGSDLQSLTAREGDRFPGQIVADSAGTLFGQTGTQIAVSTDGENWEPAGPVMTDVLGFTPWRDGLVVSIWGEGLHYWSADADEIEPFMPAELHQPDRSVPVPAQSGGWGLVILEHGRNEPSPEPVLVAEGDDGRLYVDSQLSLEFVRDGESRWKYTLHSGVARVTDQGRIEFRRGDESITVELDEWYDALGRLGGPTSNVTVVHTPDGEVWSATSWDEITGQESTGSPFLLSTDEFLLAVDTGPFRVSPIDAVAIGRPTD